MDIGPLCFLASIGIAAVGLAVLARRGRVDLTQERVRRGTGHALFGLQEFIQPTVEYVVQAENLEQKEEDDLGGDDPKRSSSKTRIPPPLRLPPRDEGRP